MPADFYFISYSRIDGEEFALKLGDHLTAGPPSIDVWIDQHQLPSGYDWDEQIVEALRGCAGLLFVMTQDSVGAGSGCKKEWTRAIKYKKPIIPLLFDKDAELPFQLEPRQHIDFSQQFEVGLARLRGDLRRRGTPEGALQALKERLNDAKRDLPRADAADRSRIESDIAELERQIADQQQAIDNPAAAKERTEKSIQAGLERERQPATPVSGERRTRFINRLPMQPPTYFQDRHVETGLIGGFLKDESLRLMTVIGRGGVGKTAMVCRLLRALEGGQLPDDGGPLAIDGIVYLSARAGHPVNFANLFADLCKLLPEATARQLDQLYRDGRQSVAAQTRALLAAFPNGRTIVLLDNFEDVVDSEAQAITEPDLDEAVRTALEPTPYGVKFLLTTRVAPKVLLLTEPALQRTLHLDEGLGSPYAEEVMKAMDADGTLGLHEPRAPLVAARVATRGYPRALEAIVGILRTDRSTTLPDVLGELRQLHPNAENVVHVLVGEAFNRLDLPAQAIMQALAVYGAPVPAVAVDYLLQPYRAAIDSARVLSRLVNMQFVRSEAGRFHLHQTDRDYALSRIAPGEPEDRETQPPPFSLYALRHRAADYFQETRKPQETWRILNDLTPQLAEFELRMAGNEYDAAATILFDIDFDYLIRWGHAQLVAQLHERLRRHLADRTGMVKSLWNLGSCYVYLGRYDRAIDCFENCLVAKPEIGERQGKGVVFHSLGLCYRNLGDYLVAVGHLQKSLSITRDIGDRDGQGFALGDLGKCYSCLGDYDRALDHLQQYLAIAEEIVDDNSEGGALDNLGLCHRSLGDHLRAIDHFERSLAVTRKISNRYGEGAVLVNLGDTYRELGELARAREYFQDASKIADETGNRQNQHGARFGLALTRLYESNLDAAREAIDGARSYDYPTNTAAAWVTTGIIRLRQGEPVAAREAFTAALTEANQLLMLCEQNFAALDTKGFALCGLALCEDKRHLTAAEAAFAAARQITQAKGVVISLLNLFDALALADTDGIIDPLRKVAAGE